MTVDERYRLVLGFASILYVNGQATEQTVGAAERLARALGLRATVCRAGVGWSFWWTTSRAC
jgi:uncharacterized membrane protein YjjP (DUF1212 family)